MHYYLFNIGDYSSHTSRLSQSEDLAYRRLLDLYYLNEQPFNECCESVAREIGMIDQLESVEYVLSKYFELIDGFWVQSRADTEIKKYQNNKKSASKAGKASAKARQLKASERALNERSTDVQPNIKHKPLTINQETRTKEKTTTSKEIPIQAIIDIYHDKCQILPRVVKIHDRRKKSIRARWNEDEKHQSREFWEWFFSSVNHNPHWVGENDRGWTADIDWLINPTNFYKVIERASKNGL